MKYDFDNGLINKEFQLLLTDVQRYLQKDVAIANKQQQIADFLYDEVKFKVQLLFDTLLNSLMRAAQEELANAPVQLVNQFYDLNLRKKLSKWSLEPANRLVEQRFSYQNNIQQHAGLRASALTGGTLGVGAIVLAKASSSAWIGGIGVVLAVVAAFVAFKIAYQKAEPKAQADLITEVQQFVTGCQQHVQTWLQQVAAEFEREFKQFIASKE